MRHRRICLALAMAGLLAACGAKGPLYLPTPTQGDLTPKPAAPTTPSPPVAADGAPRP